MKNEFNPKNDRELLTQAQQFIAVMGERINELEPKAAYYDQVACSTGNYSLRDAAKVLKYPKVGGTILTRILVDVGAFTQNKKPKQQYIDQGYYELEDVYNEATDSTFKTPRITSKGMDFTRRKIDEYFTDK